MKFVQINRTKNSTDQNIELKCLCNETNGEYLINGGCTMGSSSGNVSLTDIYIYSISNNNGLTIIGN